MKTLILIAVCLIGVCYCGVEELKPYNVTALLMFAAEDLNQDGVLTLLEIEQVFDKYDTNGNGKESRHEYTEFMCASDPKLYNLSHYLYDEYDVNGDHQLEKIDYDALFAKWNTDGDGVVSIDEFIAFWVATFTKYENVGIHDQTHQHGHSACH